MNIPKITKRFETSLASSLSASGSSFTLESGTDEDGNALSGLYGMTIDVGNSNVEDTIVTISGTTATVVYRGIDADAPNTEVTANKKAHRRGAPVVITDYPILGILRNILNADDTLPNHLKYASNTSFTDNEELISKRYADALAIAGAPDSSDTVKGLVEQATQAEVESGASSGGTSAPLFVAASRLGARLYYGYAADAGANDTYAITLAPVPTAYTAGMVIQFKANTINTGACTLNVNSLGAKSLKVNKDLDPQDGYIKAGQIVTVVYDGTNFQVLSVSGKPSVSQSGEEIYAASSTGNDTYVITVAPVPAAYATGMRFYFKPDTANTGAATINVNSLGAKSILRPDGSALANGDIAAGQIVGVAYDGTNMLMVTPLANSPKYAHGQTTYAGDSASSTQNIAHGLGRAPRFIRLSALKSFATDASAYSELTYDGTNGAGIFTSRTSGGAQTSSVQTGLSVYDSGAGTNNQVAVVTFDATNIILTWTKTGSPNAGSINIHWEAYA